MAFFSSTPAEEKKKSSGSFFGVTSHDDSSNDTGFFGLGSSTKQAVPEKKPFQFPKDAVIPPVLQGASGFAGAPPVQKPVPEILTKDKEKIITGANELGRQIVGGVVREGSSLISGYKATFKDIFARASEQFKQGDITGAASTVSPIPQSKEELGRRFQTLTGTETTPKTDLQKRVTASEDPYSLQTEGKDLGEAFGFNVKNPTLAGGIGLLSAALDFTPFGGEKRAAKALVEAKTVEEAASHLRSMGVAESSIKGLAGSIVDIQDPSVREKVISGMFNQGFSRPQQYKEAITRLDDHIDMMKSQVDNFENGTYDFKRLTKYEGKRGEFKGELNLNNGKGKFGQTSDTMLREVFNDVDNRFTSEELAQKYYGLRDSYRAAKEQLPKLEAERTRILKAEKEKLQAIYEQEKAAAKARVERRKMSDVNEKKIAAAEKSARDVETQKQNQIIRENRIRKELETYATPSYRLSLLGKLGQALGPAKYLDKGSLDLFREWDGKLKRAKISANKEMESFKIPKNSFQDVVDSYEAGKTNPFSSDIKDKFDALLAEGQKRGLDTGFVENYIPHVYSDPAPVIAQKIQKYLMDHGLSDKEALAYMNGKKLSVDNVKRLGLNPFFNKERTLPSYAHAREYGLEPKYKDLNQLAAHYRENMERNVANREFIDKLISNDKIRLPQYAPTNWQPLNLSFSPKGYYSDPHLAKLLNELFRDEDALSLGQAIVKGMANVSKKAQEIALSAGLPFTNFNFFSLGQVIKQMTAGDFKAIAPFVRANFTERSLKYFKENQQFLERMGEEGIDLGDTIASYKNIHTNLAEKWTPSHIKKEGVRGLPALLGETFDKAFNEKTFGSFMPQMYTQFFKDTFEKSVAKGLPTAEAQKLAGAMTKKMFGIIDDAGRSQGTKDALSAVFFAPRFRETIIHTLFNTGEAGVDILKSMALRKPLDPALAGNRKLLAGMILTYGMYDALNKQLNGNHIWENPENRKFALRIPYNNGKDAAYIEFMPSFLAFARNMAQGAISVASGDFKNATQKFGSVLSMPLKAFTEIWSNSDYFGREIYKDTDDAHTKMKKIAGYLFLSINHPYVKEAYNSLVLDKQPMWQALLKMSELPVKFATKAQESKNEYYDALDAMKARAAKEKEQFRSIYDNIQETGKTDPAKATQMIKELSDKQWAVYKELRTDTKRADTLKLDQEMYTLLKEVDDLNKKGRKDEAKAIVSNLSDAQYKSFDKMRKKFIEEKKK